MSWELQKGSLSRISLNDLSLRKIPDVVFDYRDGLTELSISNNRVRTCAAAIWSCVSLRKLNLSRNLLKEIPNETEGNLQYLKDYGTCRKLRKM